MADGADLIPEVDLARIQRYCAGRIPARIAHLVRLEIDVEGRSVTILECRPPWSPDMGPDWTRFPIARLRFIASRSEWTLYWRDGNLRFHRYLRIQQSRDVGEAYCQQGSLAWMTICYIRVHGSNRWDC